MEAKTRFGQNVRAERQRQALSQEGLADRAGLHATEVSRLERGVRDPRLSTIVRVAAALRVSAASLVEGVEQ